MTRLQTKKQEEPWLPVNHVWVTVLASKLVSSGVQQAIHHDFTDDLFEDKLPFPSFEANVGYQKEQRNPFCGSNIW